MWIESHQELGSHPKTIKLARLLGVSRPCVVGHLHYLWWWAMDYAQDGCLTRFDDLDIAIGSAWEGDPGQFVEALFSVGFLDEETRCIHDWDDYAGKLIERREANAERMREARAKQKEERATHVQRTQHARAGLPNLTVPNQTIPDRTEPKRTADKPPKEPKYTEEFESFWSMYPRKTAKYTAFMAWQKLGLGADDVSDIADALSWQQAEWSERRFTPHAATYLNQRRWKDPRAPVDTALVLGRTALQMERLRNVYDIETKGVVLR